MTGTDTTRPRTAEPTTPAEAVAALTAQLVAVGLLPQQLHVSEQDNGRYGRKLLVIDLAEPSTVDVRRAHYAVHQLAPTVRLHQIGADRFWLSQLRFPPAVALEDIERWQSSSPAGGLVSSDWCGPDRLATGQLVRRNGAWAAITELPGLDFEQEQPPTEAVLASPDRSARTVSLRRGYEVRRDIRIRREDLL